MLWNLNLSDAEIEFVCVTDGTDDKGIDGWHTFVDDEITRVTLIQSKNPDSSPDDLDKLLRTQKERNMQREYFKGEREETRAYSRAVKVTGGTTVYLAGHGATEDADGKSLVGDFTGQAHECFAKLQRLMSDVGGSLDDIVTMTVFIVDSRYGDEFIEIRKGYFSHGFPGSALITIHSLARPEMLVEIQAIAVLDT